MHRELRIHSKLFSIELISIYLFSFEVASISFVLVFSVVIGVQAQRKQITSRLNLTRQVTISQGKLSLNLKSFCTICFNSWRPCYMRSFYLGI
jgi:hypothetical protein